MSRPSSNASVWTSSSYAATQSEHGPPAFHFVGGFSASCHRLTGRRAELQVWQIIADKTRPVLQAVPMLRIPIDFVKRSFDQPR